MAQNRVIPTVDLYLASSLNFSLIYIPQLKHVTPKLVIASEFTQIYANTAAYVNLLGCQSLQKMDMCVYNSVTGYSALSC